MNLIDYLDSGGRAMGVGEMLLANNMNMNALRTNRILQSDEWKDFDDRIIMSATKVLNIYADLLSEGLVYQLSDMGYRVTQWTTEGDRVEAIVAMEPDAAGLRDLVNFEDVKLPIPCIIADYKIGLREILASRREQRPIDTLNADRAGRRIGEGVEKMIVHGYGNSIEGQRIYGLLTHPARATEAFTDPFNAETAPEMILRLIDIMEENKFFGAKYNLYMPVGMSSVLYKMMPDTHGKMLKTHLEEIDLINTIKPSSMIPRGNMVLVRMDADTIDIAEAQELINVEWDIKGGMSFEYRALTALVPRLKARQDNTMGIVHATFAA